MHYVNIGSTIKYIIHVINKKKNLDWAKFNGSEFFCFKILFYDEKIIRINIVMFSWREDNFSKENDILKRSLKIIFAIAYKVF